MSLAARTLNSIPLLYLALLWPSWVVWQGLLYEDLYFAWMMYESGVWSVYLLIVTLSVTPALLIFRKLGAPAPLGRWLLQRRKHFGLASFVYAALHMAHYVKETWDIGAILFEMTRWEYATGWAAFVIFAALACTSNRWSARALGSRWKKLHRWIYGAAALSFLHWYLFDFFTGRVLFWAGILAAIKLLHVGLVLWRARQVPRPA